MLEEQDIRAFVYGTTRYFEVAAQQAATVGSPYLVTEGTPDEFEALAGRIPVFRFDPA